MSKPTPTKKWKNRLSIGKSKNSKKLLATETPKEADNGFGRSLAASRKERKKGGMMRKLRRNSKKDESYESDAGDSVSPSNPQSPYSVGTVESALGHKDKNAFAFADSVEERQRRELIYEKQQLKERDGFCRRVDTYDGSVIVVDNKPTYEIGNYLGGGVAGVVYEGHRLRPVEDYPIRSGIKDAKPQETEKPDTPLADGGGFFCSEINFIQNGDGACGNVDNTKEDSSEEKKEADTSVENNNDPMTSKSGVNQEDIDVAIEATIPGVMLDAQDAPSRSTHFTKAASVQLAGESNHKSLIHGLTEEAVAVKILNPVGYRILQSDGLKGVVVIKEGNPMDKETKKGLKPMEDKHVWWLVNPSSRNLRTLQRYSGKDDNSAVQVDRGTAKKGLRLSLIAAYIDPRTNELRELTLTRCIEIWGHIPFDVTDAEFEDTMTAIERVNAGEPPLPIPAFMPDAENPPSRVATDTSNQTNSEKDLKPVPLKTQRTGLMRVAYTERTTVHCSELNAFIAIPAVPSKYLRWLRQRRSATKEIRNMMSIGRHKNVLHLFEVLEFIQESKSTMFLILELVKGGELFDLISSSADKGSADEGSESMMRNFFYELASGIQYCHKSGIAHRDLKPENLLVHNGENGERTLKIADFGLSSQFGSSAKKDDRYKLVMDDDTTSPSGEELTDTAFNKVMLSSVSALSFLTCGAVDGLCASAVDDGPSPLRRMTSVVGSPHYVAPEIILQSDDSKRGSRKNSSEGYDGSKADVWSAGVILYAMLFKSLPFGEDLLRCPRFQSYKKWYDAICNSGRRSSAEAALNPTITNSDERDYLGPHWFFPSSSSRESRDLIVAMLNPKPQDRLSVDQVLMHPWISP